MTLVLKLKCESLNTNASKTCSHSSLQYLRISLDLVTNPSKLNKSNVNNAMEIASCYLLKLQFLVETLKISTSKGLLE